jgi:hypothetical protein
MKSYEQTHLAEVARIQSDICVEFGLALDERIEKFSELEKSSNRNKEYWSKRIAEMSSADMFLKWLRSYKRMEVFEDYLEFLENVEKSLY